MGIKELNNVGNEVISVGRAELLKQIEEHRSRMVELALQSSFANEKVVEISSKLDRLLNTFHQKTEEL
ncbi:aspartyl-phosphate phosphatase Spo0E family protein [Rossellomorea vietnamensis]|jgi:hypothetical protein